MRGLRTSHLCTIDTSIEFWPSLIDLLTSALMVFLLINFLQIILDWEATKIRKAQAELETTFKEKFAQDLKDGKVAIAHEPNLTQITFSEDVLFERGEYKHLMSNKKGVEGGEAKLKRCVNILRPSISSYEQIQVEGHTDSAPYPEGQTEPPRDNWDLAALRAIHVVKLFTDEGLPPGKLSANSYGQHKPLPNIKAYNKKNRRIEIRVVFKTPK
ncbi:MAG: OmpA/MotB family protein [Blastocatellia bacterium]